MSQVHSDAHALIFSGPITLDTIAALEAQTRQHLADHPLSALQVNLSAVTKLDTAGAVFLRRLPALGQAQGKELELSPPPPTLQSFFDFIRLPPATTSRPENKQGRLESLGEQLLASRGRALSFLYLMADLTVETFAALYKPKGMRRGTFVEQALAIGAQALPIVALILFLIGAVSSLQSAAQLRQFGAHIFVADLLAIGICRELGPLMTAIIIAGRSGSAIAAEIATMKFTEELDALQTMGLDPLRFVAVPKMWAMLLCVPLLTIMADLLGILGGVFIAFTSLEVAPGAFVVRALEALLLKDVLTGVIKSISFAWIITLIAVYRGLDFKGGAAGVGRATTSSVVASIFAIILLDCFWGVIFYLKF